MSLGSKLNDFLLGSLRNGFDDFTYCFKVAHRSGG